MCSMGRARSKEIKAQCFISKVRSWQPILMVVKRDSAPMCFLRHPKCFPRWVWEWHILVFTGWDRVFASRSQLPGSHPACFFAVSQHWKYTLEWNKLLTREVGWTGVSLYVDLCNHTRHHEPRCSVRKAPSKVNQALCFFRIVTWWHQKSTGVKGESAPKVFSLVGFENVTYELSHYLSSVFASRPQLTGSHPE